MFESFMEFHSFSPLTCVFLMFCLVYVHRGQKWWAFIIFSTREETPSGSLFCYWRQKIYSIWMAELCVDCVYFLSTASMTSVTKCLILMFWYLHHYTGIYPPPCELGVFLMLCLEMSKHVFSDWYYNNSQKKGNIWLFVLTRKWFWSIMKKLYFFLTFISF